MEMNRSELETLIVQHAWKDDAFRSEFLADAKATIEKYAGQKLPAEVKVVAHAEDDSTVHFVIPQKPANDDLSDEDLEKIAGGVEVVVSAASLAVGLIVGAGVAGGAVAGAAAGTRANHGW